MVICSRCQQPVDETTRTTCPLCFTPISASDGTNQAGSLATPSAPPAAPAPPQGAMPLNGPAPVAVSLSTPSATFSAPPPASTLGANQRMTLTGDVIDAPVPMSAPPAGNSQYKPRTNYNTPQPAQEREKSGANPVVVGLVFLLLFGGGGGGWYYWMHRTNPKTQAENFFAAIKTGDAKALYATMEVDNVKYKSEKDFVEAQDADPTKAAKLEVLSGLTFAAGQPKYTSGSEATVPVTITGSFNMTVYGQTKSIPINKTNDLKMHNDGGVWKVDKDTVKSMMSGGGTAR